MKRNLLLFIALLAAVCLHAKNYTVKVGETITLNCTATAPAGNITHAVFELVNADDSQYLALVSYNTSQQTATFLGRDAMANIKVRVTYYYSYRGSYTNQMQVGHGSYTDQITVRGGGAATNIKINPSGINMKVGETVHPIVELVPAGSTTKYEWGIVSTMGKPFNFDYSLMNDVFTVTAKKAGTLCLVAQLSKDKVAFCTIVATDDGKNVIPPTSIKISQPKETMIIGGTMKLLARLQPRDASTSITWTSSDENIATVDNKGVVTALKDGKVKIKATTENELSDEVEIEVQSIVQNISLPSGMKIHLGFSYQISPTVYPSNACKDFRWLSSDTDVATVSATGKVTGVKEGTTRIIVKGDNSVATETVVTIVRSADIDHVNAAIRVSEIGALINRTLLNIK